MATKLRHASSIRGAEMGRGSGRTETPTGKCRIVHLKVNRDGYDQGGAYWGCAFRRIYMLVTDTDPEYATVEALSAMEAYGKFEARFPGIQWRRKEKPDDYKYDERKDAIFTGYLEALMWSTAVSCNVNHPHYDKPFSDVYTPSYFTEEAINTLRVLVHEWVDDNDYLLPEPLHKRNWGQYGHDMCMTAQQTGVGFKDRDYLPKEILEKLDENFREMDEFTIYLQGGNLHVV